MVKKRKETENGLVTLYRSIEAGQTRYSELKNKDIYERGWMDAHKENKRNLSSLKSQHAKQVSEIEAELERKYNRSMLNFKANSDSDLQYVSAAKDKYKTISIVFILFTILLLCFYLLKSRNQHTANSKNDGEEIKKLRKLVSELEIKSCMEGLEK
ncbi:hypothetical protein AB4510_02045 [Vibrio sp. 10N.222.54.B12]|uniref:hypothetical protein n=1 Tax=unclassified Vibrio TaxID=2614977 RepID=UPI00354AEEBD